MLKSSPHSTTSTRITIDGRTYRSVDEMPPQVRARYEEAMRLLADRDGNGVPDALEGDAPDPKIISHISTTESEHIIVNGRTYESWQDVPPEFRRLAASAVESGARGISFHLSLGALLWMLVAAMLIGGGTIWLLMR